MLIQGAGKVLAVSASLDVSRPRNPSRETVISEKDRSDTFESEQVENRSELLNSIKNRIRSGYYNSDAVIDDLSHSFAKVLDQTL